MDFCALFLNFSGRVCPAFMEGFSSILIARYLKVVGVIDLCQTEAPLAW